MKRYRKVKIGCISILFMICFNIVNCSNTKIKEKKCTEAERNLINLTLLFEKKMNETAPESEKLTHNDIKNMVMEKIHSRGSFIKWCMENGNQKEISCIAEAKKLSNLKQCITGFK